MKIRKKLCAAFLAGLMILSGLTGCQNAEEITSGAASKDFPITVAGVTIKGEPEGVAVLSPNIADVILALGYEISLKAKSEDCTQSDLSVLPNVTALDTDGIKNSGATLVITDRELEEGAVSGLNDAGIDVIVLSPANSREDLERLYQEVGSVLKGGQTGYQHGTETAENIFFTIDDVSRVIPESNIPITACYLYDTAGSAATGDTLAGKLIESAGFLNVASGFSDGKIEISDLKIGDPQYIFCPTGLKDELASTAGYQDLTAVVEGRVYEMDPIYMECQGRGMIQAVITMVSAAYPELLEETEESNVSSETSDGSDTSSSESSSGSTVEVSGDTLQKGDISDEVKALQERLDELGYMFLPCTGEFGDGTEQAVKDFQYLNGMLVTGIADPETIAKIMSDDAKPRE